MDIGDFLRKLGLQQYEAAFRDNGIDIGVLPKLTADDLRDVGITMVGHRRVLLEAIAALREPTAPEVKAGAEALDAAPMRGTQAASTVAAERRHVTVMFCDLVGSTELASRLDPEDLREVIGRYHTRAAETVARFGGFVAKYMGDGVLVYFGYPHAHEDDAEQAVRAGLSLIDAIGELQAPQRLQVRIGIATGLVVVGDLIGAGSAQEQAIVGEAPNLAARLQALAEPNAIVIAESTGRQIGARFEVRDLGPQALKGFTEPQRAWRVLSENRALGRFEALRSGATPLVGRDEELELLLRRWEQAKAGGGRVVLISGEPGVGKSRLAESLVERIATEPHIRLRYFCSPHQQDSALYPIIAQLERAAGFAREDVPEARLIKLEALLAQSSATEEETALVAGLLSLAPGERYRLPEMSAQRRKEKTLQALLVQSERLSARQPVLAVYEDVHWIDPTSLELLTLTVERKSVPVLLMVTYRPELQPPWTGQPHVTMLALTRLDRRDTAAMVANIAGNAALPTEIVREITDRTDGVPLFVEELTKAVLESGAQGAAALSSVPHPALWVPATLHASLMARLDRLGPAAKDIAQTAAAIGREFGHDLLASIADLPESRLHEALDRLTNSGLLFVRGTPPHSSYIFKHALVQDAAYGTLLRGRRQQLHARIAATLEDRFSEIVQAQPALLARHCAEAGLAEKAVVYWLKAGQQALARSAMAEAAAQFHKGLDQLAMLPDSPKRKRQELELRSGLGKALLVVKGYAAPETGHAYARARELWEQLGSPSEFLGVPFGQSVYHLYRGELDLALRSDEDLLRLSRQRDDSSGLVLGHISSGRDLFFVGRFASSLSHLEKGLALYDPISHRSLGHQIGMHPSSAYLGNVLFCLGYPDQALDRSSAAVAEARRLAHPPSLAGNLATGIRLRLLVGDNAALGEWVDQLVTVTTEQGFPHWRAMETICRGCVKVKNGDVAEGISLLRSGLRASRATGAWRPHNIALLAGAYEIAGQIEEGLTLFDDALQIVERTGERWFAAELIRHKGQLLLRQGHSEAAEELYRKALSIAEEQKAKLWELRAAVSLARLWREQGKHQEARELLAPIYGWFTEGFDAPDLIEAKALLHDLA